MLDLLVCTTPVVVKFLSLSGLFSNIVFPNL